MLFNFALEYAIRKVQVNEMKLKSYETQLLAWADNVNLLGDNTFNIRQEHRRSN
jgi:hypothetical protein